MQKQVISEAEIPAVIARFERGEFVSIIFTKADGTRRTATGSSTSNGRRTMTEQEKKAAAVELAQLKAREIEQAFCFKADVYRNARRGGYDCTNGGESSRFTALWVFTARMSRNAALLYIAERGLNPEECVQMENRKPCGEDYFDAVPLAEGRRDAWHMAGGNYLYSCDGRFFEVTG